MRKLSTEEGVVTFPKKEIKEEGKMYLLTKIHCRLPSVRDRKTCREWIVELSDVEFFKTVHVLGHPRFWPDGPVNHVQGSDSKKESKYENNIEDIESLA